jgi:hypothetical protein
MPFFFTHFKIKFCWISPKPVILPKRVAILKKKRKFFKNLCLRYSKIFIYYIILAIFENRFPGLFLKYSLKDLPPSEVQKNVIFFSLLVSLRYKKKMAYHFLAILKKKRKFFKNLCLRYSKIFIYYIILG